MDYPVAFARFQSALPKLAREAMEDAARAYAGIVARPGRSGVSSWQEGIVQRRFTASNNHAFQALSDKKRWITVRRKSDGRWIRFEADGYATWKRKRFGSKPILVATGKLRESLHRAVVQRVGDNVSLRFSVPDYGRKHHDGNGVPRRSPVQPNAEDRALVKARAKMAMEILVEVAARRYGIRVKTTT